MDILRGVLGISVLLFALYLMSNNRKAINWRLVLAALTMQIILGLGITQIAFVRDFFDFISKFFLSVIEFTRAGTQIVFGSLVRTDDEYINKNIGYIFAFHALPTIVFFSALSSILYYLGILQKIIYGLAWIMSKLMRLTGAESLAAAANVFVGQTEAPLVIKPYLARMSKSEILCLMTGGMATIAGGVMVAYVGFLGGNDPAQQQLFATHLLTASIMSAPAAILAAKMMYPEDREDIDTSLNIPKDQLGEDLLDAISIGTKDGIKLAINVGAMLIVFSALVALVNAGLSSTLGTWISFAPSGQTEAVTLNEHVSIWTGGRFDKFNFEYILGLLLYPVAWIMGAPAEDCLILGQLLGKKTILNEFVAYADMPKVQDLISYKTKIIATYALCGFANFASIGIQLGGIGTLAPEQRKTISELGIRALIAGTFACFFTAIIAGALTGSGG